MLEIFILINLVNCDSNQYNNKRFFLKLFFCTWLTTAVAIFFFKKCQKNVQSRVWNFNNTSEKGLKMSEEFQEKVWNGPKNKAENYLRKVWKKDPKIPDKIKKCQKKVWKLSEKHLGINSIKNIVTHIRLQSQLCGMLQFPVSPAGGASAMRKHCSLCSFSLGTSHCQEHAVLQLRSPVWKIPFKDTIINLVKDVELLCVH